jgi:hypothetical protein
VDRIARSLAPGGAFAALLLVGLAACGHSSVAPRARGAGSSSAAPSPLGGALALRVNRLCASLDDEIALGLVSGYGKGRSDGGAATRELELAHELDTLSVPVALRARWRMLLEQRAALTWHYLGAHAHPARHRWPGRAGPLAAPAGWQLDVAALHRRAVALGVRECGAVA